MLLFVDNADSFTFNLVHALRAMGEAVEVVAGEDVDPEAPARSGAHGIVLGPGPGRPEGAQGSLALLERWAGRLPLLGICLGHQLIAHRAGAHIAPTTRRTHGQPAGIRHAGEGLFRGLPSPLRMTRYNSLTVVEETLPPELLVSARDDAGEVMALHHSDLPLWGLQFHPEGIRSVGGLALLERFLQRVRDHARAREASPQIRIS